MLLLNGEEVEEVEGEEEEEESIRGAAETAEEEEEEEKGRAAIKDNELVLLRITILLACVERGKTESARLWGGAGPAGSAGREEVADEGSIIASFFPFRSKRRSR